MNTKLSEVLYSVSSKSADRKHKLCESEESYVNVLWSSDEISILLK